ncbi:MAG TPA: ABC transporter substrate-binding protein [bacterium]|nr:ABC transporter substrate-binding protein [bacterium]
MRVARRAWAGAGIVVLALALAWTGMVTAAPSGGGTLTVGLDQEPPTLDPEASPSAVTFQIIPDVTESLLYQGLDGKILPWLATAYKISPDGKSFTFTLRTDAKFTDGTPVNADAVKWNFDRVVNPNYKAGGALVALSGYVGSTVIDDHTVRVDFKAAYAPFLSYLAGGNLALVSPKATQAQGNDVNLKPVGSGQFIVSEYVPKDHITLTRNADYNRRPPWSDHQGPAYLDKIIWKFIPEAGTRVTTVESGETQMISGLSLPSATLTHILTEKTLRVERNPYPGAPRIWVLNVKLAPTNDLKVRQALNYGVNRPAIVEAVFKGLGTTACAPLTQQSLKTPALCNAYPYDPKKAAQILDEDGWKMGPNNIRVKDGKPLTITINSINYGNGNLPEVELLQGQLLALGVDARIKSQARPPWYEDNYHCATNGPILFLRSSDPDGLWALFATENIGGNFNWACYSNPDVDKLLQQGKETYDPAKRVAIYTQIEKILVDQAVSVPLVDEFSVWVLRSNVTGSKYNFSGYPVLTDVRIGK